MKYIKKVSTFVGIFVTLSFFLCFKSYGESLPRINHVKVENASIGEVDRHRFSISSLADEKVQYRIWVLSSGSKTWEDITEGYSTGHEIKTDESFEFIPEKNFDEGSYKVSIWTKRYGKDGINKNSNGDYDNYYAFELKIDNKKDAEADKKYYEYRLEETNEKKEEKAKDNSQNQNIKQENGYEVYMNNRGIGSNTNHIIWVETATQSTFIYEKQNERWKLIKVMPCSTGKKGDETPLGVFKISDRGSWFYSLKYGEGAKYWVRFYGNYLFHSVPFDRNENIVDPVLGIPASHGCVRLLVEDAKWIYDNISKRTTVFIN